MEEVNSIVHPVETQWHYPIMVEFGFEPVTKKAQGIVRSYNYQKGTIIIECVSGYTADYWNRIVSRHEEWKGGLWKSLRPYLESIN